MIEKELVTCDCIDKNVILRNAVRAIINKDDTYLLIFSKSIGDYKFPGGGIEKGENFKTALVREIHEECGMEISNIKEAIIKIKEKRTYQNSTDTILEMISEYFLCDVGHEISDQNLDDYEKELGFTPCWIKLETAIEENKRIANSDMINKPIWLTREIWVMEKVLKEKRLTTIST